MVKTTVKGDPQTKEGENKVQKQIQSNTADWLSIKTQKKFSEKEQSFKQMVLKQLGEYRYTPKTKT